MARFQLNENFRIVDTLHISEYSSIVSHLPSDELLCKVCFPEHSIVAQWSVLL
jgi:hypothetical protein